MAISSLENVNHEGERDSLCLIANPKTDIVAIPSIPKLRSYQFTSPISKISMPAAHFKRARVTILWSPLNNVEFDQVGLIFIRPKLGLPQPSAQEEGDTNTAPSFVKFGLEHFQGAPVCAVGASNPELDWSLWPTTIDVAEFTVELVRYGTKLVACVPQKVSSVEHPKMSIVRVLSWPLEGVKETDPPIWIGIYAARPDLESKAGQSLTARFKNFEVDTTYEQIFRIH